MIDAIDGLSPTQREVALYQGHCLVIATAGSGKSKTVSVKAADLLQSGQRIAAVTFTREAALELRERIIALAGPSCRSRLLVGTFHSICMLMAFPKKNKSEYGSAILANVRSELTQPWNLVKEGVRRSYILRAIAESGMKMSIKDATAMIELYKETNSRIGLEDAHLEIIESYRSLMEGAKVIDFSDIILNANTALREKLLTPLAVDHLMVDEFQDTDKSQYEWIAHHARSGIATTVVGDDDQSIYGFRRALGYEGMQRFVSDFDANRIHLGANYRCRSEIMGAAEKLIKRNTERIAKELFAHKGEGGVTSWEMFNSKTEEANAVAEEAFVALQDSASFAVISRTNSELLDIQRALIERDIEFKRTKEDDSIFDRQEVQAYSALLRTILKPVANDVDQVLAWAGLSVVDSAEIRRLFGTVIRMGSKADFANSKVSETGLEIWRSFAKKHSEWQSLETQGLYALLNEGVYAWLSDHLNKPNSVDVLSVARDMHEIDSGTLQEKLKKLANAQLKLKTPSTDENAVALMTAHGSKGLEFDRVWIIGLKHGVFPSEKSGLEEERRLMFVAITRAREVLYSSSTTDGKPSIFVAESGLCK